MKKVGFITCQKFANLYYDDVFLKTPFAQEGLEVVPIIWNQIKDYSELDILVFRSAWDYHFKTTAFVEWLASLKKLNIPICNPVAIIQENYDKFYLKNLQENGFAIIPTLFFEDVRQIDLKALLNENAWSRGVIKPAISMSAYQTYAFDQQTVGSIQAQLVQNFGNAKVMVQKFAEEIVSEGEWSLVFYDKQYCMAALKKPQKGDFRVQTELGGTVTYLDPPKNIIVEAKAILDHYTEDILYARMDGIVHKGRFQLMEAELIDPELYFRAGEKGQQAFLKAVKARIL